MTRPYYFLLLSYFCCLSTSTLFAQATNEFFTTDNNQLHYRIFGNRTKLPLLIINGGPGMNSEGFASLAEKIDERKYYAILYDQRGTGKSTMREVNENTITLNLLAKDIEALRQHLKVEEWAILGHSFGGLLASYYTSEYPEKVTKLILSSAGGVDMTLFEDLDIRQRLSPMQRDSLAFWVEKINKGDTTYYARLKRGTFLAPAYLYDKNFVPQIAQRLTQTNMSINSLVFNDLRKIKYDCKEKLSQFKRPVLVIQGKQDIIPEKIALLAKKTLPQAKVVFVDKSAHYGWLEQPKIYLKTIHQFLNQ